MNLIDTLACDRAQMQRVWPKGLLVKYKDTWGMWMWLVHLPYEKLKKSAKNLLYDRYQVLFYLGS